MKLFLDVSRNAIQLWKAEEYCLLRIEFDFFGIENYTNISFSDDRNYFIDTHTYPKFVREFNRHQIESLRKKKFVLEFFNYRCYLYRRNSKHKYNSEPILTIDYSTHDVLVVDITFNKHNDICYDSPSVKYDHHLKYIRKMSRAAFAFYKVTNELKKWEM